MKDKKKEIIIERTTHKEVTYITIRLINVPELEKDLSSYPGLSRGEKINGWYCEEKNFDLHHFFKTFSHLSYINYAAIKGKSSDKQDKDKRKQIVLPSLAAETATLLDRYGVWMNQKRYGKRTVEVYVDALKVFFRFHHQKKPDEITHEDILVFNNDYIIANDFSATYQNQMASSLKAFYQFTYNRNINIDKIERPRRGKPLPKVIPKEVIQMMLSGITFQKHRVALALIYATGLRRSELINP